MPAKTRVTCPECQQTEAASLLAGRGESIPEHGDTSICAWCGILLRFNGTEWRRATPEEIKALPLEYRLILGRYRLMIELRREQSDH